MELIFEMELKLEMTSSTNIKLQRKKKQNSEIEVKESGKFPSFNIYSLDRSRL